MEYQVFVIYKNGILQEGFFLSVEDCYKEANNPECNFYEFVGGCTRPQKNSSPVRTRPRLKNN